MTNTLLKLSAFDKSIFWRDGESYWLLGIIGVLLGLLVGGLLWYKCGKQAKVLERSNQELRDIHGQLQDRRELMESIIEDL